MHEVRQEDGFHQDEIQDMAEPLVIGVAYNDPRLGAFESRYPMATKAKLDQTNPGRERWSFDIPNVGGQALFLDQGKKFRMIPHPGPLDSGVPDPLPGKYLDALSKW